MSAASAVINLTKGQTCLVDADDLAHLSQWKWHASRILTGAYQAVRMDSRRGFQRHIFLHNVIMSPPDGFEVDHINRNPLDNRRSNLRLCEHWQNCANRQRKPGALGFRGIRTDGKTFAAQLKVRGKYFFSGGFATPEEAARAYDRLALEHAGEFAITNFGGVKSPGGEG